MSCPCPFKYQPLTTDKLTVHTGPRQSVRHNQALWNKELQKKGETVSDIEKLSNFNVCIKPISSLPKRGKVKDSCGVALSFLLSITITITITH